jgi:hypothetical protein
MWIFLTFVSSYATVIVETMIRWLQMIQYKPTVLIHIPKL